MMDAPPVWTGTITPHARLLPSHRQKGTLAIYIKTTFHDLQPFTYLQEDLRQFCKVAGPVVISVPDDHMTAFRAHVFSGYELMSDSAVARSANVYWPIHDNWYSQQMLKLCAGNVLSADAYLVLDSNTIINAAFDESMFQVDGRWIYEIDTNNEDDLAWERRIWTFLKVIPPTNIGFRPVNQVFEWSELEALRRYLERIYNVPWGDLLYCACECANRLKFPIWTEFQLYGAFISMISERKAHILGSKNPLMYFSPKRHLTRLPEVLSWFAEHRPFMVKAHKQRPGVCLSASDYEHVASAIRAACRGD